jgi:type I restriction enzyme M protein
MNLLLHGIGDEEHESPIVVDDALKADPGERFELVLTNPPFGRKSSMTFVSDEGDVAREDLVVVRDDFWASTSNKQLNFVQHVKTLLAINGRAAVVVPDNVLFEGGAGETVRRRLLDECDVHTLLRLPTGVFYAQGVKANVLFFDRKPASEAPWTRELGSTTCARTSTSRSSRIRCAWSTSRTSSRRTAPATGRPAPSRSDSTGSRTPS